jgi:hypothetical protein
MSEDPMRQPPGDPVDALLALDPDAPLVAGRLWGLPELPDGELWVEINGAAAITGVAPRSITSHLAKGGPKRNPFPGPTRALSRLFWPLGVLRAWADRERTAGRCDPDPAESDTP